MSHKVWIKERLFPTAPVFDILNTVPGWCHWLLYDIAIACLCALLVKPLNKYLLWLLLLAEVASCMLDQNRWQPWEYQYLFTMLVALMNRDKPETFRQAFTFIIIATYIYSGLNKFTPGFLYIIWDRMILSAYFKLPAGVVHRPLVFYSGYMLGLAEFLSGIGLLFRRTSRPAACVLIVMHLFNLLFLGPLGLHYNRIVWPWNAVMILYLYILFIRPGADRVTPAHYYRLRSSINVLVLLCWGILPAFSFAGWWDSYLSVNLYSGHLPVMYVCVGDTAALRPLRPYFSSKDTLHMCEGLTHINTQSWAMKEMNVPPYPERRVYKKIRQKLEQQYPAAGCSYTLHYYSYSGDLQRETVR